MTGAAVADSVLDAVVDRELIGETAVICKGVIAFVVTVRFGTSVTECVVLC